MATAASRRKSGRTTKPTRANRRGRGRGESSAQTKRKKSKKVKKDEELRPWQAEALAIGVGALGIFTLLAVLSQEFARSELVLHVDLEISNQLAHLMGPIGKMVGTLLLGFMGWAAFVPALGLIWAARQFWVQGRLLPSERRNPLWMIALGVSGIVLCCCALLALAMGVHGGGSIGVFLARPAEHLINTAGATLFYLALFAYSLGVATEVTIDRVLLTALELMRLAAWFFCIKLPKVIWSGLVVVAEVLGDRYTELREACVVALHRVFGNERSRADTTVKVETSRQRRKSRREEQAKEPLRDWQDQDSSPPQILIPGVAENSGAKRRPATRRRELGVEKRGRDYADYKLPELKLLTAGEAHVPEQDHEALFKKSREIEGKLRDFNIVGKVTTVHPGPVITLYEFKPAPGVKVGKIASLSDDLAMSLHAVSVRIIAPIPGRGTVGIEVPNQSRAIVRLRDVIESSAYQGLDSPIPVGIGKDTYGQAVATDISVMPHLLIAGATGTGKSVCINSMLVSLLYRATPAELGLILIDPKILELSVYEGIPHLRVPIVTDARQARAVLQWAVNEMERRYKLMQKYGVRSISGYNMVARGDADPTTLDERPDEPEDDVVELLDVIDGELERGRERSVESIISTPLEELPKIVIVIDELADLMLSVGKEIETLITRLAQKARAAGIHLIVATQRPSVDVVTGLIKANFPARLSFKVSSRIDSRTILDQMGAEKLLGRGDMLLMLPTTGQIKRVHGAFVSDAEVKRVIQGVKKQGEPEYDAKIIEMCERALQEDESSSSSEGQADEFDPMYDQAVQLVIEKGQASTSMVQRALRIGYNRAARIIDCMEREGVVGPMDGAKPREVLVGRAE